MCESKYDALNGEKVSGHRNKAVEIAIQNEFQSKRLANIPPHIASGLGQAVTPENSVLLRSFEVSRQLHCFPNREKAADARTMRRICSVLPSVESKIKFSLMIDSRLGPKNVIEPYSPRSPYILCLSNARSQWDQCIFLSFRMKNLNSRTC